MLESKESRARVTPNKKERRFTPTVRRLMQQKANDNTPPLMHWFFRLLIVSLLIFTVIEGISRLF